MLQPILLLLDFPVLLIHPSQVRRSERFTWSNTIKLICQIEVEFRILALLCFCDGNAVGIKGKVRRAGADAVESVKAG